MTRRRPLPQEIIRSTGLLVAFVAVCVAAGVLLSGLFVPAAATVGFLTSSSVNYYDDLPTELETETLPERSTFLAADGGELATIYSRNRSVVPLSAVSENMTNALLAIEDSRFREHGGVDIRGTIRALVNNLLGGDVQGASTLTQQYVKNVLLENAEREGDEEAIRAATVSTGPEGYQRKLLEVRYAIAVEEQMTKDEILESYLNIANYGDGAYGIFEASWHYFQVAPSELTIEQAAMLAGQVQQPTLYDPVDNPDRTLQRRNVVLGRMLEVGSITQAEHDEAVASPLSATPQQRVSGCDGADPNDGFFCNYVEDEILDREADAAGVESRFAALGATWEERLDTLLNGGITVTTTLDPAVQAVAVESVRSQIGENERAGVGLASVQPGTGHIVAMAQNRRYSREEGPQNTVVNYATGGDDGFQTGSTFKAFTLARWLETGRTLREPVNASEPLSYRSSDFTSCVRLDNQQYSAGNAGDSGGESGIVPVERATFNSINTAYMRMAQQLNLCDIRELASRLGVTDISREAAAEREGQFEPFPTMVLGVGSSSPLDMAGAYATFAAEGLFCPPTSVTSITDRNGEEIDIPAVECTQALDVEVARGVNYALQQTVQRGTAASLTRDGSVTFPAAGKTGTTQGSRATWFAGYTPNLAAVVWIGDSASDRNETLTDFPINGQVYGNVFGSTFAAPTWGAFMPRALDAIGAPPDPFVNPGQDVLQGPDVPVPSVVGTSVDTAEERLSEAGLTIAVSEDERFAPGVPNGLVAAQEPRAGAELPSGSSVTVFTSAGFGFDFGDGDGDRPRPGRDGGGDRDGGGGGD